jgi:hypothetical protein
MAITGRNPADATEGAALGVRLFPGDDTPRTFIDCNLLNCEPPPGSIVQTCNTKLVRKSVPSATKEDDVVVVDGVEISRTTYHDYIALGRWTPSGYEYEVPAIVGPEDY